MLYCLPLLVRGGGLLPASRQQCWTALVSKLFFEFENWIYKFYKHGILWYSEAMFCSFGDPGPEALQLMLLFATHFLAWTFRRQLAVFVCSPCLWRVSEVRTYWMPNIKAYRLVITPGWSHKTQPGAVSGNDSRKLQDWRPTTGRKRAIKTFRLYFWNSWDFW